jgi:hexosaminidase
VDVLTSDDELRFGVDESYNLTVAGASATISANTVFGALWGLETLSQLIHRVWSTGSSGAVNASYYQVCEAAIQDAPRFPYRGEATEPRTSVFFGCSRPLKCCPGAVAQPH